MVLTDEFLIQSKLANPDFETRYQDETVWPIKASNASRWRAYLKAKKINDISNLNDKMNYDADMADIANYLKYAKQDYVAWLAKTDANMADALQQATESYGAQNLLWSGIQIARTTEMINDEEMEKQWLAQEKQNTLDKYNDLRNRTKAKYEQVTLPINELNKPEYKPLSTPTREQVAYTSLNGIQ